MTAKSDQPVSTSTSLVVHPAVTVVTAARDLRLEVGAKVRILQHKHLRCSETGYVQRINGGYNYVHPDDRAITPINPEDSAFELYPNEIKVVANYRHNDFRPGVAVRIRNFNWGKSKARSHGIVRGVSATRIIVQPIGARKDAFISVAPEDIQVESNQSGLSAEALHSRVAVLGVLRCYGAPIAIATLKSLLDRQAGVSDVEGHLAQLANSGTVTLTESHAALSGKGDSLPTHAPARTELHAAIAALAEAERRLTTAVHQAILQG